MEQRKDVALTVDFENSETRVMSGAEIYKLIFDSNMPVDVKFKWNYIHNRI